MCVCGFNFFLFSFDCFIYDFLNIKFFFKYSMRIYLRTVVSNHGSLIKNPIIVLLEIMNRTM